MLKYKDTYQVKYERDIKGKIYNRNDNYISCRAGGQIYRKDKNTLVFLSPKKIQLIKKDKETGEVKKDFSNLIIDLYDTLEEREITFKEENLEKLEELFKPKRKKEMSEEFKEQARQRMVELHKNKKCNTNDSEDESTDKDDESDDVE